jgi:hypothetical protein
MDADARTALVVTLLVIGLLAWVGSARYDAGRECMSDAIIGCVEGREEDGQPFALAARYCLDHADELECHGGGVSVSLEGAAP